MFERKEPSAFAQLLLTIGLMLGGLLLTIIVSLITLMLFFNAEGGIAIFSQLTEHIAALKALQIIQGICLFIVPAYFFGKIISSHSIQLLKLNKGIKAHTGITIILLMLAAIPFINLLGDINAKMDLPDALAGIEQWMKATEEQAADMTAYLVSGKTLTSLFINLIMIAVIPAVGEEMLFRGVLQRILLNSLKNVHLAVIFTAFFFSAFHLQFYGFLPRFFIGIILGYLFVYSGSLWLPILAHFTNNAAAVIVYYLQNKALIGEGFDTIGTAETWIAGLVSAGIILSIYFYIVRNKTQLKLDEFK